MTAAWEIQNSKPVLLIGMPHKDYVSMEWTLSFRNLQVNVPAMFTTSRGTPIDMARNEIVRSAEEAGVEWLFFLDTDVTIPPDTINRLMSHKLPIVSGVYYTRAPPLEPAVWQEIIPNGKRAIQFITGQFLPEVDFIGMGCCLIHMSVFKNIKKPYFEWTLSFQDTNDITRGCSEDFDFCKKVRARGYKIAVDTSIQCRHGITNAYANSNGMNISMI